MNFLLTTQDVWCTILFEHKMLFYLTLYKGLILSGDAEHLDSALLYLILYKGLIL